MSDKPFAYVCSPYRGDTEANVERARDYCREVFKAGYIPLAPHLYFPQFLNDSNPKEREAGMEIAASLLPHCRVLVVCGDEITDGIAREINLAKELGIECASLENIPVIPTVNRELSVYIANVEDYESGELVGTWLHLPATREAFQEALAVIGADGSEQPGYFVEKYQSGLESIELLPAASDIDELNYLAINLERLSDPEKELFDLVMLSGKHENTVCGAINITENIDCFGLQAIYSPEQFGKQLAAAEQQKLREVLKSLGITDNGRGKEIMASIDRLEKNTNYERLGLERAAAEDGVFTVKGYLSLDVDFREYFHGPDNVPRKYRLSDTTTSLKLLEMSVNKVSVLAQIAAARAEHPPESAGKETPRSRGPEL